MAPGVKREMSGSGAGDGGGSVVVFGSCTCDLVLSPPTLPKPGVTVMAESYALLPGGKGANQAAACSLALGRGGSVRMVGCVGEDAFASIALSGIEKCGVDVTTVRRSSSLPTAIASVVVESAAGGENQICVGKGANGAAKAKWLEENDAAVLQGARALVLQMESPLEEQWEAVRICKQRGLKIILNVAPVGAVPTEVLKDVDVLIVNEHEAIEIATDMPDSYFGDQLPGRAKDAIVAAMGIAKVTSTLVVVTLGSKGATAVFPPEDIPSASGVHRAMQVGTVPVEAIDTVGAGDAFVGAFTASIVLGLPLSRCLQRASCAGSLACLKPGAQTSLPDSDLIDSRCTEAQVTCKQFDHGGGSLDQERYDETKLEAFDIPCPLTDL